MRAASSSARGVPAQRSIGGFPPASARATGMQSAVTQYRPAVPRATSKDTVRMTIDLDAELHRDLKRFALEQPGLTKLSDVVRASILALLTDETVAAKVGVQLYRQRHG